MTLSSTTLERTLPRMSNWPMPLAAIMLGGMLVYLVGFAQVHVVHDAAHDVRHAAALPCH
ncbi:MAG: CbtB domain-containing protein [Betaproteobacteria bacterium]|jgi:cobalt transporter subunit CbtB